MGLPLQKMKNAGAAELAIDVPWGPGEPVRRLVVSPGEEVDVPQCHENMLKRRGLSVAGVTPAAPAPRQVEEDVALPAEPEADPPVSEPSKPSGRRRW